MDFSATELTTYEQDRELIGRYLKGESQADLARDLGLSRERIRQRLQRNGFQGRNYRWVPDRDVLLASVASATSPDDLGQRLGLDPIRLRTAIAHHQATAAWDAARDRWRSERQEARKLARQRPMLNKIRALALQVGHTPTQDELQAIGISHVEITRVFGSVPIAMRAAQLEPNQTGRPPMPLQPGARGLTEPTTDRAEVQRRAELLRRLDENIPEPAGSAHPKRVSISTSAYYRDPKVAAWVLQVVDGVCEACGERGYETDAGLAYLEVHHVVPLSEGGPDTVSNTVAVCETCHGKLHRWARRKELETSLYAKLPRLQAPTLDPARLTTVLRDV